MGSVLGDRLLCSDTSQQAAGPGSVEKGMFSCDVLNIMR